MASRPEHANTAVWLDHGAVTWDGQAYPRNDRKRFQGLFRIVEITEWYAASPGRPAELVVTGVENSAPVGCYHHRAGTWREALVAPALDSDPKAMPPVSDAP